MVTAFISSFWFHKLTLLCKIQVDEYDIRNEECKYISMMKEAIQTFNSKLWQYSFSTQMAIRLL